MDSPNDNRHDHHGAADPAGGPPLPVQAALEALLDASEADVAAGRTTKLGPMLDRMRATAERLRRQRAEATNRPG